MSRGRALAFAPPGRIPVDLLVPVMGGVVLGLLLVVRLPLAAAAAVAALGGLGLLIVGARSTVALSFLVPGVILGGMKFRIRGAGESLSGAVDANVLFELGMYGVVLALALSTALNRRLLLTRPSRAEGWLLAYAVWATLTALWSVSPTFTAVRGLQLCVLVVVAAVLVRSASAEWVVERAGLAYGAIVTGAAALAVAFPWARVARTDWFSGTARFSWFADHPITVAIHGGLAVVFLATVLLARPPWLRLRISRGLLTAGFILVGLAVMVATVSRMPVAAVLATLAAMVAVRYLDPRQATLAVVGIVALLSGAALFASPLTTLANLQIEDSALLRMILRDDGLSNLLTFGGRLDLWREAAALAAERPLHGYGFVASRGPMIEQIVWAGHAHNGPLQSVLDLGVVGALLLWIPVGVALLRALRTSPRTAAHGVARIFVVGSLTFMILVSLTDPTIAGPPGIAFLSAALAILMAERLTEPAS